MSIRKKPFVSGEYYHLYNRGNSKQRIFKDKNDYQRFIGLMYACNQKNSFKIDNLKTGADFFDQKNDDQLVAIGAYCIMPNHFHILITEIIDGGISKFMQKLTTAYVMYYNNKYKRTGSLFEGKFKSEHLDNDRYLKYLFSYIHLNPIKLIQKDWKEKGVHDKNKALIYLADYSYSSYDDYLQKERKESGVLNRKVFPDYFPSKKTFIREIFDWLGYRNELR